MFENAPDNWMERRDYPDLPDEAEHALRAAAIHWEEPQTAQDYLEKARSIAPDHLQVHIATYKFLFYSHQYVEAAKTAQTCIELILLKRQIHKPMLELTPEDAPFDTFDPEVRFLMNCIMAYGYCLLRQGDMDGGKTVLDMLAKLDCAKQTSVLNLIDIVDNGPIED
ncbi:MAG: hypothetical protein HWE34_00775 [Methylocystaceae bacterium]|nr:hypothetical protein [Methylocystaceae bacterium]